MMTEKRQNNKREQAECRQKGQRTMTERRQNNSTEKPE